MVQMNDLLDISSQSLLVKTSPLLPRTLADDLQGGLDPPPPITDKILSHLANTSRAPEAAHNSPSWPNGLIIIIISSAEEITTACCPPPPPEEQSTKLLFITMTQLSNQI